MEQKKAIITGIRGQVGSYLADYLLAKGYKVVGVERRCSNPDYSNIQHLLSNPDFILEQGDITDGGSIVRIVKKYQPDEFYNTAAMSFVGASWDQPLSTCDINFMGVVNCLEAIRLESPKTKFLQSSTSEVYGDVLNDKQNEETPARPRSPYAAAKYGAESLVKVYRDSYKLFACFYRGFNSESQRRGPEFVTRKITRWIGNSFLAIDDNALEINQIVSGVQASELKDNETISITLEKGFLAALELGLISKLRLGNLDAKRDWTHAMDIVRGMWLMLQQDEPDDFVLGSGTARSIKEFLTTAFGVLSIEDWEPFVEVDPKFYRPADVNLLCADASKAKEKLGWEPRIPFEDMVREMVHYDMSLDEEGYIQ